MFDFIANKKYFFCFSGLIFLAGIIALIIHTGFNLDIQFQGGTIIEIQMNDSDFSIDKAREIASNATGKNVSAQSSYSLDSDNDNNRIDTLVLSVSSSSALNDEEHEKLVSAISKEFNIREGADITTRHVDPAMGKEMAAKSIFAVILASALMLVYVWIRFNAMNGLLAGFASVVALVHDIGIMLTLYAITDLPVNDTFIAAILTILGYSINDTIVIFDRIRENSVLLRKESLSSLTNKSIFQTLSRTINTALTTIMSVLIVFLFAAYNNIESITNFALPMLVGLVSGTYSTIFIASPLWVMLKERQAKKQPAGKPVKA